jgi:hypothetical protein
MLFSDVLPGFFPSEPHPEDRIVHRRHMPGKEPSSPGFFMEKFFDGIFILNGMK